MLPILSYNRMQVPALGVPFNRLDSFFDRALGADGGSLNQSWAGMAISMWEDDDFIGVEAEVPGVAEQDLDVTVHHDMLSIRGVRKPEEGRRYLFNNRPYGRFERTITLPEAVKADDVQATLVEGILRIVLPKSPEARPRKITLKSG